MTFFADVENFSVCFFLSKKPIAKGHFNTALLLALLLGMISATATSAVASTVNVYGNSSPDNGHPAYVKNLIAGDADSTTGALVSAQNAYGLSGGWSPNPYLAIGGYAVSILEYTDERASSVSASVLAQGGEGGKVISSGPANVYRPESGSAGGSGTAEINITTSSSGVISASALGGKGGNSASGCASCLTNGGYGGNGGDATATANAISSGTTGTLETTANAIGGSGGSASGPGYTSGAGGVAIASARGVSISGQNVTVTATQKGGNGGDASRGDTNSTSWSDSGDGAESNMVNSVSGETTGQLYLTQSSTGGNGGAVTDYGYLSTVFSGQLGDGGNAKSSLTLSNAKASSLSVQVDATGGNAGKPVGNENLPLASAAGKAGDAEALLNVSYAGAGSSNFVALSTGGLGGDAYNAGDATSGGKATTTLTASIDNNSGASGSENVILARSTGGQGGNSTQLANGGNGGDAKSLITTYINDKKGTRISNYATGGNGGLGYGTQFKSGNGGQAETNSVINNVASGTSDGALYVDQSSTGGDGGDILNRGAASLGGRFGNGGDALSYLKLNDSTSGFVSATLTSTGGNAGKALANGELSPAGTAGLAGNATTFLDVLDQSGGTTFLVASSFGGRGGDSYNGSKPTSGGNATTTVILSTEETATLSSFKAAAASFDSTPVAQREIALTAGSTGGAGGDAYAPGNGGKGGDAQTNITLNTSDPSGLSISASAEGGKGGNGYGASFSGGDGGAASLTYALAMPFADDNDLYYSIREFSGDGGNGLAGAKGGNGASVSLSKTISDITNGRLYFELYAGAGEGGSSDGSVGGTGGNARSVLTMMDSSASYLEGTTYAMAGFGGETKSASAATPYGNGFGKGGDSYSETVLSSTVSGTSVEALAAASSSTSLYSNKTRPPQSIHDYTYFFSGDSSAKAAASGVGTQTTIKAKASIAGETGLAQASSTLVDSSQNRLVTKASAPMANSGMDVGTYASSGYHRLPTSETYIYGGGAYNHSFAKSLGNIARTADEPLKLTSLGSATGDFTVIGNGLLWAQRYNIGDDPEQFSMYASYTFSELESGNSLLFGLNSGSSFSGAGLTTFSLTQDGNLLFSGTFSTQEEWDSFSNSPLYLGEVDGTTNLELAMTAVIMERGAHKMNYAFVVAPYGTLEGSYTNVAPVPLPGAAPLFAASLFGLNFYRKRRKSEKKG